MNANVYQPDNYTSQITNGGQNFLYFVDHNKHGRGGGGDGGGSVQLASPSALSSSDVYSNPADL